MTSWLYPTIGYVVTAGFWAAYLRWSGRPTRDSAR